MLLRFSGWQAHDDGAIVVVSDQGAAVARNVLQHRRTGHPQHQADLWGPGSIDGINGMAQACIGRGKPHFVSRGLPGVSFHALPSIAEHASVAGEIQYRDRPSGGAVLANGNPVALR